jgi:hypothetical protein
MKPEQALNSNVGIRHVIEDSLAAITDQELDASRRNYVLSDLVDLLERALKGSDLVSRTAFFVGSEDRSAFEAFSFLGRYLGQVENRTLRHSLQALEAAQRGDVVSVDQRREAVAFLQQLLATLKRRDNSGIPEGPEFLSIPGME